MALDYKLEGDVLVVSVPLSVGLDKDKDGVKSVEVGGELHLKIDGGELVDELVKSSSLVEKIKAKLGL